MPSDLSFDDYCRTLHTDTRFHCSNESDTYVTFVCPDGGTIQVGESKLENVLMLRDLSTYDNTIYIEESYDNAMLFFCFLHSTKSMYEKYKTDFHKNGVLARMCQKWEYTEGNLSLDSKDIPLLDGKGLLDTFDNISDGIEKEFHQTVFNIVNRSTEGEHEHDDCEDGKCEHYQALKSMISSLPPDAEKGYLDALFCATNRHMIRDFYETFGYEYDSDE